MTITLGKQISIGQVQEAFSVAWPHLKIHFFTKGHGDQKGINAKFLIDDESATLGSLSTRVPDTVVDFAPDTPVNVLEQHFEQEYGLHLQVFRQSGEVWLETTVTDNLTLAQQEEKGRISLVALNYSSEQIDYREQD